MKTLAIELSSKRGSLAWLDDETGFESEWDNDRKHSGTFFENLSDVRTQFGMPQRIIVGLGPGSYAGVRIALSTAIGLQAASDAELIGYPSICAMACDADDYLVVGDARRGSFYLAEVAQRKMANDIQLHGTAEFKAYLDSMKSQLPIFSSDYLPEFGRIEMKHPSAKILARLAQIEDGRFLLPPLQPIYLREPHITTPKMVARGFAS
ncbi:MAG: tRNA threonylcarbamoyladenosine biosynthesis protein TsaB [Verrucomicrobiota bacterium]|jgi:tRNA threonylcarbamoyladenosine biosynthesis protein TsaB